MNEKQLYIYKVEYDWSGYGCASIVVAESIDSALEWVDFDGEETNVTTIMMGVANGNQVEGVACTEEPPE